jgi:biopolymer transport protein ExbD
MSTMRLTCAVAALLVTGCNLLSGEGGERPAEGLFELNIDLPQAASGAVGMEQTIHVGITADEQLYINGKVTNAQELDHFLADERARNPGIKAVVVADKTVRYQKVVEVIDLLIRSGIDNVSLGVEPARPVPMEPVPAPAR